MSNNDYLFFTKMSLPSPDIVETEAEELASRASGSSSSSFVPIDEKEDAIQVINEDKQFNSDLLSYVTKTLLNVDQDYHIISVFGSQSTGKSTLLNRLFNTNFDVMDETQRRLQTTRGIWMAHSPLVNHTINENEKKEGIRNKNIFVMDVEGTDGRERGEDQDFERKAALFALATTEILIINIWETQVGLYQGANMGLLKTVFEVNLKLFGKLKSSTANASAVSKKISDHKVLLLFVIRDHLGVTPKEALADTITDDLKKMWDSLTKPTDLSHFKFSDFFDVDFHTIGHKVLQPEKFEDDVKLLGDRLINPNDTLFNSNYHHGVPVDGWALYAENCWDQIDNNKDLDLPTQQILVAQFKCEEFAKKSFDSFVGKFIEYEPSGLINDDYDEIGRCLIDLKNDALEEFDSSASLYNESIYKQRRLELSTQINSKVRGLFDSHADKLTASSADAFKKQLIALKGRNFYKDATKIRDNHRLQFVQNLQLLSIGGELSTDASFAKFDEKLDAIFAAQQKAELRGVILKGLKKLATGLTKEIQSQVNSPTSTSWDNILAKFKSLTGDITKKHETEAGVYDFGLGTNADENAKAMDEFKFKSWVTFDEVINKLLTKDSILALLKERFEDKFRYDANGVPRLYENTAELEVSFQDSKVYALKLIQILGFAKLSDDSEIVPDYDIYDLKVRNTYFGINAIDEVSDDEDEEDEDKKRCFAEVISEKDKAGVLSKFKKEIDARFIETKKSIIQHVTQIPYYIYLIILVLGWNEFMAILRNPLLTTLILVFGGGLYVLYRLGQLNQVIYLAQHFTNEALSLAKERLREVLVEDYEAHGRNLERVGGKNGGVDSEEVVESIEMQDL